MTRVELLSQHYLHVDDVDLFVGGRLERLIPGTLAGITFQCIMGEQFFRWKFGDRWFYDFKENPASFTLAQLLMHRPLRTRLDVLHPDRQTTGFAALPQDTENMRVFTKGAAVWARQYGVNRSKWMPAVVTDVLGRNMYLVSFKEGLGQTRHIDLRKCHK
ncbi:unnamed protein product [Timema podura]|uniref:Uncharacterized protein n=1 Tax=Timema podura TaxID=61482 RepID=A0ABN7NW11_TIMPD|nr:unnamed protein product [Timema podura]